MNRVIEQYQEYLITGSLSLVPNLVIERGEGALDQLADPVADHRRHLLQRQRAEPMPGEQHVHRGGQVGRRIDQRTVEVEQYRPRREARRRAHAATLASSPRSFSMSAPFLPISTPGRAV